MCRYTQHSYFTANHGIKIILYLMHCQILYINIHPWNCKHVYSARWHTFSCVVPKAQTAFTLTQNDRSSVTCMRMPSCTLSLPVIYIKEVHKEQALVGYIQ